MEWKCINCKKRAVKCGHCRECYLNVVCVVSPFCCRRDECMAQPMDGTALCLTTGNKRSDPKPAIKKAKKARTA